MMMRRTAPLLAMAGLLALAACHSKDEEAPPPAENDVIELNNAEIQAPEAPPVLEPETPTNNVAAPTPPPPPKVSEDQQMLDDAAATGLTSRLPDDNDGASAHGSPAQ